MIMESIPVFIHHESDEKPSKGLGKKQSYLKYVIAQAESLNSRVILFGDEFNSTWAKEWYPAKDYLSEKWYKFETVFVNMSDYPDEWAKGIFRRFFIFEEYCKRNDIKDFVVLDSDVLIYIDLSTYPFREKCKVALEWESNVSFKRNPTTMSSVVSSIGYFTITTVGEFTEFCIKVYEKKEDYYYKLIVDTWENHFKKDGYAGGICEMTLLYLWLCERGCRAYNILAETEKYRFCLDFSGMSSYLREEFVTNKATNTKRLKFIGDRPYHKDAVTMEWVKVDNIHFVGDSKRLLPDVQNHKRISIYNMSYYVLFRFWRGKVKPLLRSWHLYK